MNTHSWKRHAWRVVAGVPLALALLAILLPAPAALAQGWPALEAVPLPAQGGGGEADAAVLIGVDEYWSLPPVRGAEANMAAWERWLIDGRKVPNSKVELLRGKSIRKRQVQAAVEAAAAKVGASGTLYLVFAGHGAPAGRKGGKVEPHLLLANTDPNMESFVETGIGVDSELSAWAAPAVGKGAKVVAVLDACFTGKGQAGEALIEGGQFAALSSLAAPSRLTMLTAASSKDITGPLPGASRPAFSYLVLAALRGWGDDNNDGMVTAQEAVDFAAKVMREAQRAERPALSGDDLPLGKSGGEAAPKYRDWLGRAVAAVVPRPGPVVTPILGADADIAALAAQAERAEADRKAADEAARRAEEAAVALAAAKAAESRRLVAQAQASLRSQVERDFGAIRRLVEAPSDAARPALEAFVAKYGAASVSIDGVSHLLEVPEVALVERALASRGAGSGGGVGPAGIEWVRIEGGSFQMGSSNGHADEKPMRRVAVPSFELAKTEVTNEQYARCVADGDCKQAGYDDCELWTGSAWEKGAVPDGSSLRRGKHPVVCVDWAQATAFASWAKARLPSEAEWEFAARSRGQSRTYPWGDTSPSSNLAVFGSRGTAPVCSKSDGNSAQGVCDLAGNVWEWVDDWYGPYDEAPTDGSARSRAAELRVFRGGCWYVTADRLRAAYRYWNAPGFRSNFLGFRLAR